MHHASLAALSCLLQLVPAHVTAKPSLHVHVAASRRAALPSRAAERAGVNAARLLGAIFARLRGRGRDPGPGRHPDALRALLPPLLTPLLHALCPPRGGEAPSLAAKEAVYGLLTDLLAVGVPPAWLLPPPADPGAGFELGLRTGPARDLPLHTCAPLDEARVAAAMRVFLAAMCGDAVHCARGADGAARAPGAPANLGNLAARPAAQAGGSEGAGSQDPNATQADPNPITGGGGGLSALDDIECRRATARLTVILNKPRPDDALAPVLAQPPPLAVPASYAPAAGNAPGAGLRPGRGTAAGALRGADFKWALGRRALGFLIGLAAGGGAGAEWALLAAPALRAVLADAERSVWTRVGHPLRPAYGALRAALAARGLAVQALPDAPAPRPRAGAGQDPAARAGPNPGAAPGPVPARRPPEVNGEPAGERSRAPAGPRPVEVKREAGSAGSAAPDAHRPPQVKREAAAGAVPGRACSQTTVPYPAHAAGAQVAASQASCAGAPPVGASSGCGAGLGPQAPDKAAPRPPLRQLQPQVKLEAPSRRGAPDPGGAPAGNHHAVAGAKPGKLVADVRAQLLAASWPPAAVRAAMQAALRQLGPRGLTAAAWRARAEALLAEEAAGP